MRGVEGRDKRCRWSALEGAGKADCGCSPTLLRRAAAQSLQGYLGGVLLGLVDVLAVVPEARRHADVTDVDTAGPSGTASCEGKKKRESASMLQTFQAVIELKRREVAVCENGWWAGERFG